MTATKNLTEYKVKKYTVNGNGPGKNRINWVKTLVNREAVDGFVLEYFKTLEGFKVGNHKTLCGNGKVKYEGPAVFQGSKMIWHAGRDYLNGGKFFISIHCVAL